MERLAPSQQNKRRVRVTAKSRPAADRRRRPSSPPVHQADTEMAAPVLRSRTPTGTEPNTSSPKSADGSQATRTGGAVYHQSPEAKWIWLVKQFLAEIETGPSGHRTERARFGTGRDGSRPYPASRWSALSGSQAREEDKELNRDLRKEDRLPPRGCSASRWSALGYLCPRGRDFVASETFSVDKTGFLMEAVTRF